MSDALSEIEAAMGLAARAASGETIYQDTGAKPDYCALDLGRWGLWSGRQAIEQCPDLKTYLRRKENAALIKETYPDATKGRRALAGDFWAALYDEEIAPSERPINTGEAEYLGALLNEPEFQRVRRATVGNSLATELVLGQIVETYLATAIAQRDNPQSQQADPAMQAAKAAKGAKQATEELEGMLQALGCGSGAPRNELSDHTEALKLFKQLQCSRKWRNIVEWAGKYVSWASQLQRSKLRPGLDQTTDVVLGRNLRRLLASERGRLACGIPEVEEDALLRLMEGRMLCREMTERDPESRGPIVVCVDESGSMDGQRNEQAKGLCLALCWIARHQRRPILLSTFADGEQTRLFTSTARDPKPVELSKWVTEFMNGGTSYHVPLAVLPKYIDKHPELYPQGETDVILISDGCFPIPLANRRWFCEWKQRRKARLTSVLIGEDQIPEGLAEASDRALLAKDLGLDSAAVQEVLSV